MLQITPRNLRILAVVAPKDGSVSTISKSIFPLLLNTRCLYWASVFVSLCGGGWWVYPFFCAEILKCIQTPSAVMSTMPIVFPRSNSLRWISQTSFQLIGTIQYRNHTSFLGNVCPYSDRPHALEESQRRLGRKLFQQHCSNQNYN